VLDLFAIRFALAGCGARTAGKDPRVVAVEPDLQPTRSSSVSPLLVGCLVAAIAATIGLGVLTIVALSNPPPPPPSAGASGHPPPPNFGMSAAITVAAALFAIAWVSTFVALSRDHILRRIDRARAEISAAVTAAVGDYGDHRETEGYVHGRRQGLREAAQSERGAEVVTLRPVD
jgi:hypothetical protein